jgi:hypothetical protein
MRIAVAELTLNNNADALRNFWVRIPAIFLGPAIRAKHMIVVAAQSGKNANIPIQSLATFAIIAASPFSVSASFLDIRGRGSAYRMFGSEVNATFPFTQPPISSRFGTRKPLGFD